MGRYYTVDLDSPTGRFVPSRDQVLGRQIANTAMQLPARQLGGGAQDARTFVGDARTPSPLRTANAKAWKTTIDSVCRDAGMPSAAPDVWRMVRDHVTGAKDAFTVAPSGSAYLDLIGRLARVALMPRPAMLFDEAFPDRTPFTPGVEQVQADLVQFSGRPKFGWKGSLNDIPTFRQGVVSTLLGTMWSILNIPIDIQQAARSALSAAAMSPSSVVANGMDQFDLGLDYVGWNGDSAAGIHGLLDNPALARNRDLNIDITTSTGAAIYASIIAQATYAVKNSKGVGMISKFLCSYKVKTRLISMPMVIGGTAINQTVWGFLTENLRLLGITEQVLAGSQSIYPLDDVGGTGVHGILFYSDAPDRRPSRLWGMETTAYPDQSNPLISQTYVIAVTGDVQIWRADSILLALVGQS